MTRIRIVGGSDAGISAVLLRGAYPNFSICGLPFLIGGQVDDPARLAHRGLDALQAAGLEILPCHCAIGVDPPCRTLEVIGPDGLPRGLHLDRLLLATALFHGMTIETLNDLALATPRP